MENGNFAKNRDKLKKLMEDNSAWVFFAGHAPMKDLSSVYPFNVDKNFYYLTGIEEEGCILLIYRSGDEYHEKLFINEDNGEMGKWIGKNLTQGEAYGLSGVEDIDFNTGFLCRLREIIAEKKLTRLYVQGGKEEPKRPENEQFAKEFLDMEILDSLPAMAKLRVIKEPWELERMEKAISITKDAFEAMMKNSRPEMYEYEVEAEFDYVLKKNGVFDKAFDTIAASGKNAVVLHYSKNNCKAVKDDMILVDAGASWKNYMADITRTFPLSGKFTDKQKQVYEIVLGGNKLIEDYIRPGIKYETMNEKLIDYYEAELKKIGLIETRDEISKYYYHKVGHFLGLETHDVGLVEGMELAPGMVVTVEPGLYIEEWGIGVRIEDDVLVTEDGSEVLSKDIIKEIDDIERFMAENRR
ncbi:MAG: aminopeptidase P family protein [Firmicutes bacterium]|nr:aminopeptidase P family protein [Bacillota bacterium]